MKKGSTLLRSLLLGIGVLLVASNLSAQQVITVGTGTNYVSGTNDTPFGTFYHDDRSFYLYTASQIIAAGGFAGDINSIAWNVASAASQPMNTTGEEFE